MAIKALHNSLWLFTQLLLTAVLPLATLPLSAKSDIYDHISPHPAYTIEEVKKTCKQIIKSTHRIKLRPFPRAFNPSIVPYQNYYMLAFRHTPSSTDHTVSHMGIVLLNQDLSLASYPQLLPVPVADRIPVSQTEDPRLFTKNGSIYLLYNDNPYVFRPNAKERRDMYLAELINDHGFFSLKEPEMLFHKELYEHVFWQKNWVPFVYQDQLFLEYSFSPHEVLAKDADGGCCRPIAINPLAHQWRWGAIRGGTPALEVNGQYLAFFHSSIVTKDRHNKDIRYYYMGAYTFSKEPPFTITGITPYPIVGKHFYDSDEEKRVIFPGGFVIQGRNILLAYGKDDKEIWIATIDKAQLLRFIQPLL